jgi:hypothetical protein
MDWVVLEDGNRVQTNRTVELSYDLKKTIENAKNIQWFCKCPYIDTLSIAGNSYGIFGDCSSQDGCQLISCNGKYYLIKKKLLIVEKQSNTNAKVENTHFGIGR